MQTTCVVLQPAVWLLLGIIALVKFSFGKLLLHAFFRPANLEACDLINMPMSKLATSSTCQREGLQSVQHANVQACHLRSQADSHFSGADYLLVIAVAVVLSSANVIGYTKCSKQASAQLRDMARNAMTTGLTVSIGTLQYHLCLV